jgi:NADH:ubiquinone oxidoreductase subunit 6 (subunit J)
MADSIFFSDKFTEFFLFYVRTNSYIVFHISIYVFFFFIISLFSFFLIFLSNPIYSVISLIVVYLFVAFVVLCFDIHFLAVVFILIYLGAVVVLFLFIVMMLNIKIQSTLKIFNIFPLIFLILGFFFFFNSVFSFKETDFWVYIDTDLYKELNVFDFYSKYRMLSFFTENGYLTNLKFSKENYVLFGFLLYTYFYVEIIVASYILLLAMVGCITLTLIKDSENIKRQEPMEQLLHRNMFLKKKSGAVF